MLHTQSRNHHLVVIDAGCHQIKFLFLKCVYGCILMQDLSEGPSWKRFEGMVAHQDISFQHRRAGVFAHVPRNLNKHSDNFTSLYLAIFSSLVQTDTSALCLLGK